MNEFLYVSDVNHLISEIPFEITVIICSIEPNGPLMEFIKHQQFEFSEEKEFSKAFSNVDLPELTFKRMGKYKDIKIYQCPQLSSDKIVCGYENQYETYRLFHVDFSLNRNHSTYVS
jgi:hypothetical protein